MKHWTPPDARTLWHIRLKVPRQLSVCVRVYDMMAWIIGDCLCSVPDVDFSVHEEQILVCSSNPDRCVSGLHVCRRLLCSFVHQQLKFMFLSSRINLPQTCTVSSQRKATTPVTLWPWVQVVKQPNICFCGNIHSCRGAAVEKQSVAAIFIYFAVIFELSDLSPPCVFFVQLLEAQADYHRKSLIVLESVLPTIQAQQGKITWITAQCWKLCAGRVRLLGESNSFCIQFSIWHKELKHMYLSFYHSGVGFFKLLLFQLQ